MPGVTGSSPVSSTILLPSGAEPARGIPLRAVRVAILLLLLSACTQGLLDTQTPPSQEDLDRAECRRRMELVGPRPPAGGGPAGRFAVTSWQTRRQEVFDDCMRQKGYPRE